MRPTTITVSLEPLAAALAVAQLAVARHATASPTQSAEAERALDQALVELACGACDALAAWERDVYDREHPEPATLVQRVAGWRGQVDDLRVQLALAQLELRGSPHHTVSAVAERAAAAEHALTGAVRDISAALGTFRDLIRRAS